MLRETTWFNIQAPDRCFRLRAQKPGQAIERSANRHDFIQRW